MRKYIMPATKKVALDSEMLMLGMPVVSGVTQDQPDKPGHPGAPARVTILSSNGKVF